MNKAEEVFRAADKEGLGLADYIKKYYNEQSLCELEQSVESQLNSLRFRIADFMSEVEISRIDTNLLLAGPEKLESMQDRIKETIRAKKLELENLVEEHLAPNIGPTTEEVPDL